MCKYCEEEEPIIEKTIDTSVPSFGEPIIEEIDYIIFIRGTQLCIGDKNDSNCIDHTTHETINFCPNCGKEL